MCALAILAAAARPLPPAPLLPDTDGPVPGAAAQSDSWADTGILPSSANQPPPEDPGMVKVSVPQARRLLILATTPTSRAARHLG
jgi:hypothetical protein